MRMPLIPLITVDPYFSVWTEDMTKKTPVHWTHSDNTMLGTVLIDGEKYRFLGRSDDKALDVVSVDCDTFSTIAVYEGAGIRLTAKLEALNPMSVISRGYSAVFDNSGKHGFLKLDMSEFMEKHTVSKLIGSPPGYVGYDEAGQLTEKIRRRPYSVVLFDEIEKAHPDVLNILLQVLDDGRITDSQGRVVNFENAIIVMTSNAGSEGTVGGMGFGRSDGDQVKEKTMKALRGFLRPEFINRVDEIITFNHLTEENFLGIADIMLEELSYGLECRGLTLTWSDAVRKYLVDKAYSVTYGARNLRRTIQRELEDPISEKILDSFEHPVSEILIDVSGDKLLITAK